MNDKMSVEIPSDRENHQKENLTINEDPPSYSNEDSNQDIRGHLLTSPAFPISVPPNVLPIQEPDQYYPVPSRRQDPPSYSNEDSNQHIRGHLLTSPALPISVPPNVLPIQEPDQYYPVPSRPSQEVSANVEPVVKRITGKPQNYLEFSILNTLFCCTPIGLLALFYSIQVNIKYSAGRISEAILSSQSAKKLNIAAFVTGTIIWIVFGIYPISRAAANA